MRTEPDVRSDRPAVARTIGRFVIERELGAGGMGLVLLARDPTLDRHVAIKVVRATRVHEAARLRMLREAQAMAKLRHVNVAAVYEAGEHDGEVFLVMEYIAGGTLRDKLGGASVREILRLFVSAGTGLAAAHAAGIVHRDFKPDNVLVDDDGVAKVTDFGLAGLDVASLPEGASYDALGMTLTQTGDVMGTPNYMAPEQHRGEATDTRTDQFTFCAALYEAVYRRLPFAGNSVAELRASVLDGDARKPPDRRDVPGRVRAAILRGLASDPADRFSSMQALLVALAPRNRRWVWAARATAAIASAVVVVMLTRDASNTDVERASHAARACDCELYALDLPTGAVVTGVRTVTVSNVGPPLPPYWQATRQLAVPRGPAVIDYRHDGEQLSFAVVSHGGAAARSITLPAAERRPGYTFVPGGEIIIGEPSAPLYLAPYLIARTEAQQNVTYELARGVARDAHARLASAAEWEWAARIGAIDDALEHGWEWTATAYASHPYIEDGRDDSLAPRTGSEVRGIGTIRQRREGAHGGVADVRLARTSRLVPPLSSVELDLTSLSMSDGKGNDEAIAPNDRTRLDRLIVDWQQLDTLVPIELLNDQCTVKNVLVLGGIPDVYIDATAEGGQHVMVRLRPDRPAPNRPVDVMKRRVVCGRTTEVLDLICFSGDDVRESSLPIIKAVAETLRTQKKNLLVTAYAPGTDGEAHGLVRANKVRALLIRNAVPAKNLRVRGALASALPDTSDPNAPPTEPPRPCPQGAPGERVTFEFVP